MVCGEQLLASDHGRRAEEVVADQLHDMAADGAGAVSAHHRMRIAGTKKKSSRSCRQCERPKWNLLRGSREAMRLPHDDPSCQCASVFCVACFDPALHTIPVHSGIIKSEFGSSVFLPSV